MAIVDEPESYKLLSIKAIKPGLLQDGFVESYIEAAKALLEASSSWPKGKTYVQGAVRTRSQAKSDATEGFRWHIRESLHEQPYEEFRTGLLKDHSRHETEYIESCDKAMPLNVIEEGVAETYNMLYRMPFLTTNREFPILIITKETTEASDDPTTARSFLVISIPIESPAIKGYTRARYVSVEECREDIEELPDGAGTKRWVRWRMAVKSDAGGRIPAWISELAVPGKISEDVPSFLAWSKRNPAK